MADESTGLPSALVKAVTFTIVIALAGILFVALALAGGLSIGKTTVAVATMPLRTCSAVVGLLLLCTAVFLEFRDRAGRRESTKQQKETSSPSQAPLLQTLDTTGAESFPQMVKNAVRVDILSRTAVNLLSQYEKTFLDLGGRGCQIRLLFVDPSCQAAQFVYGDNSALYDQNVATALTHVRALRKRLGTAFQVHVTKHAPTMSLIAVDRAEAMSAFVHVQLYFLHGAVGRDRPVFKIRYDDAWFSVFRQEFDQLWRESVEWNN
jgi:hypothetical protein